MFFNQCKHVTMYKFVLILRCSLIEFDVLVNDTVNDTLVSRKNRIQVCLNNVQIRLNQGLYCITLIGGCTGLNLLLGNHFSIFPIFVNISVKYMWSRISLSKHVSLHLGGNFI